jgi:hypothetical protein
MDILNYTAKLAVDKTFIYENIEKGIFFPFLIIVFLNIYIFSYLSIYHTLSIYS